MKDLLKFITSNKKYIVIAIIIFIGFITPGMLMIFRWDKELFLSLSEEKLLMLSFVITFAVFIPVFIICGICLLCKSYAFNKKNKWYEYVWVPWVVNNILVYYATVQKIICSDFSIKACVGKLCFILSGIIIFFLSACAIRWIKTMREK